jgi:hypothetical protein
VGGVQGSKTSLVNRRGPWLAALAVLLGAGAESRASITGVCPDGSIFVVQSPEAVPCSGAKEVEPGDLPPIKPELLPRPYAWEVFNQQQNPNNPYNLIDAARQVREARAAEAAGAAPGASTPPAPPPENDVSAPPPSRPAAARDGGPVDLGLSDQEARDLALIVDLSQQRAPAAFARGDGAAPALTLRVAPSAAFEGRLREAFAARGRSLGGPVLLFTVSAAEPASFHPNFTFVQGHQAFHPDPEDPSQLGWIRGGVGELTPESEVLGYVVLPEQVELAQPLDIYWDDRQITATLRP